MIIMRVFTVLILLFSLVATAQLGTNAPWMNTIVTSKSTGELTYDQIKEAGEQYWSTHDQTTKGSGYKPFLRWLERSKPYIKADGTIQSAAEVATALENFNLSKSATNTIKQGLWNPVGPFTYENTASWSPGQGRINTIAVDPNQPDTYYVGAPSGGLWKSTNAGLNWTPLTDFLAQIGVSAIAIDKNDSDTIYIGTGDDDAGDSSSIGLLKSTDGGATFMPTALSFTSPDATISEVYINPTNSSMLYVASNKGFYKSHNAGLTVKRTFNGNVKDIKLQPGQPNTIYLATDTAFFKSTDAGESFTQVREGLPYGISRMVIGVSQADANRVYLLAVGMDNKLMGVYQSRNAGDSFLRVDQGQDIIENNQAWYNLALEVSQTNADVIYTGALNIWKSNTGGTRFEPVNTWNNPESPTYTHADIHQIREFNGKLFVASDGGIYRSANQAASFTDLTQGLQIGQFYRIAVGSKSSSNITGGLQDNGGYTRSGNTWKNFHGADGMDAGIDPTDENVRYSFTQFGNGLYIANEKGALIRKIEGPAKGNWITPLKTTSEGIIYAGYDKLYKVEGDKFVAVSASFSDNIDVLEIDPIYENIIYVAVDEKLFKSEDSGNTFSWINNLPGDITAIEVNHNNNNILYVATGTTHGKVMQSDDMGTNFKDITYNLPHLGKNTLAHLANSADNALFLGTTVGIFKYLEQSNKWASFSNNLPNVNVRDLEINTNDLIMTAGTYGRGVWQTQIELVTPNFDLSIAAASSSLGVIDCGDQVVNVVLENKGKNPIKAVTINYTINGISQAARNYDLLLAAHESTTIDLDNLNLEPGAYEIKLMATTAHDKFLSNNFKTLRMVKNNSAQVGTVNDFEQTSLVTINDKSNATLWQRGISYGAALKTTGANNKVYATNLNGNYTDLTLAYLYTGCYDLSSIDSGEFQFDMAYDLEQDWDVFYVQYSINNGASWELLGNANDDNWYNSATTNDGNNCFNCKGGQWTGTNTQMTTYKTSIDQLAGKQQVIFRFVFHSDQSINQEGVILDNVVVDGKQAQLTPQEELLFTVYPNPSTGVFNITWKMQQEYSYQVSDLTGKTILRSASNNIKEQQINLSGLAAGMYFLQVSSQGNTATKKLIVR